VIVLGRAAVAEKGLIDLGTVNGKGLMLGAVSAQTTAILVNVFIVRRLVHIPYAAVTVGFEIAHLLFYSALTCFGMLLICLGGPPMPARHEHPAFGTDRGKSDLDAQNWPTE
jgi:hypothetical protein